MTTHEQIITAARSADTGFDGGPDADGTMADSIVGIAAVERFYAIAFQAGATSRDADIERLKNVILEAGAIERAAKRELVESQEDYALLKQEHINCALSLDECKQERDKHRAEVESLKHDAERLNHVAGEYLTLEPFERPTGGDDSDVGWRVLQHHCGEKKPRVVAEVFTDCPRSAIDAAMKGEK